MFLKRSTLEPRALPLYPHRLSEKPERVKEVNKDQKLVLAFLEHRPREHVQQTENAKRTHTFCANSLAIPFNWKHKFESQL